MTLRIRKALTSNLALTGALTLMAACWSTSAAALDLPDLPDFKSFPLSGSYYGGLGFGSSGLEPNVSDAGFDVSNSVGSGMQLFIGRDVSPRISIEGYYSQLGEAEINNARSGDVGRIDYSTIGASGLFYLLGGSGSQSFANRSGFSVYGRLGVGNISNTGVNVNYSRADSWSLSSGLGAEYNMKNGFGLRAELHNFDSDARVVSLNVVKRFRIEKNNGRLKLRSRHQNLVLVEASSKPTFKDSDGDGVKNTADDCSSTEAGTLVDANGCEFGSVLEGVTFSSGSSKLTQTSTEVLDQVVGALKRNNNIDISVQAHTDNRGDATKNMELSRKRATNVVRYLTEEGQVDLERISAVGYGEAKPLKSNRTELGRTANRRVEIKVME